MKVVNGIIEIKLPLGNGSQVMTSGREFSYVNNISGEIDVDYNVSRVLYSTDKVTRYRFEDFNRPKDVEEKDYKTIKLQPKYLIGDEILVLNSTYSEIGILKKVKVTNIEFHVLQDKSIMYFYGTSNKTYLIKEIYSNIEDFVNRTKPKKPLTENQKYIFTKYMTDQNKIEAVDVEKISETHFKITKGYDCGETVRGSKLYNSVESFINHMTSQI